MNASVSQFHGARQVRGPGLARMISLGALSVTLALATFTARSEAHLIRIDGDYLYMTEDFESVEGDTTDLGFVPAWGNGVAIDASDLWHRFSHDIGRGYGRVSEDPSRFPYLSSSHPNLQFVLVDSEMPPGSPGERNDGWGLLLRDGYEDVITLDTQWEILEFSCDVFLGDTFPIQGFEDSHAIDFIGSEGCLRYFLSVDELTQHVVISQTMFADFIGEIQAVRLESSYGAVFDNLTVKTWANGPPGIPEPGFISMFGTGCLVWLFRRTRRAT